MRLGDGPDDRQAEARRAAAVAVAAHEALEHVGAQVGRDAGAVVLDREDDLAVARADRRVDPRPGRRVADGVLHEVERHPVQLVAGAVDDRGLGVDGEVMVVGERAELGRGVHEDLPEVGRAVRLVAVRVRAGEQEEVADEPAHALRGAQRRVRGLAALAVEDLDEQLEVGEDARERRAQLVRGVRDELALALERLLRLVARCLEAVEHVLERAPELGDLVVGARTAGASRRGRGSARCRARRP